MRRAGVPWMTPDPSLIRHIDLKNDGSSVVNLNLAAGLYLVPSYGYTRNKFRFEVQP